MLQTKKSTLPWLAAGILLSLLIFLVVSGGLSGKVWIADSAGIPEAADSVMHSIRNGDWKNLSAMIAGNPGIAPVTGEQASAESMIWKAYQDSLQWTCADTYDLDGARVTQNIAVSCLDIRAVTDSMTEILAESAPDETNRIELLREAARQVLESDPPAATHQITLTFLREAGQWKLIPDRTLQMLLSGFTVR